MTIFGLTSYFSVTGKLTLLLAVFSCLEMSAATRDSTIKITPRSFKLVDATLDFYTTLNGSRSSNAIDEQMRNNIYLYYNFTIQNRIKIKKVRITNYFFNELGIRNFKDSIVAISEDIYNFKNSVSLPIYKSRFSFNLTVSSKSQFWRHYTYEVDSNKKYIKNIYTSYLSPGYVIYSGGLRYNFWGYSSLELGLASGRTTKIRNQDIFVSRKTDRLYGLDVGKRRKTILGIHILVNISSKRLFKNFYMEQFSQVFMDKDSLRNIKSYSVDVNNAFHYLLLKYVRFSIRTKFLYDKTISPKPAVVQQFSIGFYLNNKL